MADEGFHEIQLKGKQLVFLFMAATVVAVVIFLCGVMVGRGVPARAASASDSPEQVGFDTGGVAQNLSPAQAVSRDPSAPATARETLTYATRLEDADPPAETLVPAAELATAVSDPVVAAQPATTRPLPSSANPPAVASAAEPAAAQRPAPVAPAAPPSAAADADATLAEPPGTGFVVQVAAVRQRDAANAIALRLSTKGYPAFVTVAGPNFRVRVGKYSDRGEAESVAGRLEKEERFTPWITR